MQIMFVIGIFILNALILANVNLSHEQKAKSDSLNREMYEKFEFSLAVAPLVKIAYDLGQVNPNCLAPSREVNLNPNNFRLCWVGLDANNCFDPGNAGGFSICLANNQSLAGHIKIKNSIAQVLVSNAYAGSGGPGGGFDPPTPTPPPRDEGDIDRETFNPSGDLDYVETRNYTKGNYIAKTNTAPLPAPGLSNAVAGARVIIPPPPPAVGPAAQNVIDFVDCQRAHTECFNVSFCTNGSPNCTAKNKITQTFAVRHY